MDAVKTSADPRFLFNDFCDELGPAKVIHLYDPEIDLRGILVIDNVACGPSIGGIRMACDVTTEEVFRLARAMTLKNASAGLPHGGGKAGIMADPGTVDKKRVIKAFASAIRDLKDYIPGPDMGTDETCMAWIHDTIQRAVGLPRLFGGIPLDEIGATGFGVAASAEVAADFCKINLSKSRMAIEGFGNVGRHAARFLAEKGVVLVAASDSHGAIHDPDGIDINELCEIKRRGGSVTQYAGGRPMANEELQIPTRNRIHERVAQDAEWQNSSSRIAQSKIDRVKGCASINPRRFTGTLTVAISAGMFAAGRIFLSIREGTSLWNSLRAPAAWY